MSTDPLTARKYLPAFLYVTSVFLLWALAITNGDTLNRTFQKVLHISLADSGLIQFSIFGAYAVMGIPAGYFMKKYGYKRGILLGLGLYALGAFLFYPATEAQSFSFYRVALFVLACGCATLETVAHPFIGALGSEETSEQRINFGQTFNGVGAIIGPQLGGYFILRHTPVGDPAIDLLPTRNLYLGIGVLVLVVAVAFSLVRVPVVAEETSQVQDSTNRNSLKHLFRQRHFVWAVVAQFFNVAAQGGTWAYFINYGVTYMPGLTDERAAYWFSFSMLMMLAGRALGTWLMRFIRPNLLLACFAMGSILLCLVITQTWGWVSFGALILLQFTFSIMFPTIFGLGLKGLGPLKPQASSFLVMGVFGGAVFPLLMGWVADQYSVAAAYYLPILCYAVIVAFGLRLYRVR